MHNQQAYKIIIEMNVNITEHTQKLMMPFIISMTFLKIDSQMATWKYLINNFSKQFFFQFTITTTQLFINSDVLPMHITFCQT